MSISFFGASVTAQKDGYTDVFKNMYIKENPNKKVFIHGFGSMHLFDAGIMFIDDVIQNKPTFCFIDWFSTGFLFNELTQIVYLDTILYKLHTIKCIPIILFLDRNPAIEQKRKDMYKLVKEYIRPLNISYIDVVNQFDASTILRDCVHTNTTGSNMYGTYIFNQSKEILKNKKYPLLDKIPSTKFCFIQKITLNKKMYKKIVFEGSGTIIGIYQVIGPHSSKCKIKETGQMINIFDEWCHYERKSIKCSNVDINGTITLQLENSDMDELYQTCRKQELLETLQKCKKYLDIEFISYIGKMSIKICE